MAAGLDDIVSRSRRAQIEEELARALRPRPRLPAIRPGAVRCSLLGPRRRLRPGLALPAEEAGSAGLGVAGASPWPAACAVEMSRTCSLLRHAPPARGWRPTT